jgi:peptidoglycan hydrolase-like protein with peptidoglycan-binding domain
VTRIQTALARLGFSITDPAGAYGQSTKDAVLAFKGPPRNILGPGQTNPDGVVGIQTIDRLDGEMFLRQGGGTPRVTPVDPAASNRLDIYVLFNGAPSVQVQGTEETGAKETFNKTFNTAAYLKTHKLSAVPICFFGGRGATDRSQVAAADVVKLRKQNPNGVTIVHGVSVGGRTALNAAALLTAAGIKLDYVAINDGAFFAALSDIRSFKPLRILLPGAITADRKDNFFQTFGHELLIDPRGPGGFMTGAEFHGPLDGFTPIDVRSRPRTRLIITSFEAITPPVRAAMPLLVLNKVASRAHVAAVGDAAPSVEAVKRSLIKP